MESAAAGAALGVAAMELYRVTVAAAARAASFRHELRQLQSTIRTVTPKINQIDQFTSKNPESFPREVVEEIQMFKLLLTNAKVLVMTCSEIPSWRIWKKYRYAKKIRTLNESLGNLLKIQGVQMDVIMSVLARTNKMNEKLLRKDTPHEFSSIPNSSPIKPGHRINETIHQNESKAIYCCSWCCVHGPACLGSHQ